MRTALEDVKYEFIKAHVLDPENSPLSEEHQQLFDRVVTASKILDKNPVQKQAVLIHMSKYKEISRSQAYEDMRLAAKLFNTFYTFDYDFWRTWLINDIVRNIERAGADRTPAALRVIALEHSNLIKAIGEKPDEIEDPKRLEKQANYVLIQVNNTNVKIDIDNLHKMPESTVREVTKAIFGGKEITEADVIEIFNT